MQGHCWVLADNESLAPPHVIDSRSFGPLPLSHIVGRCGGRAAGRLCCGLAVDALDTTHLPPSIPAFWRRVAAKSAGWPALRRPPPPCPAHHPSHIPPPRPPCRPRRILYAARSDTDHGPVENSEEGMAADAPVIEAELDIEALCQGEE